MNPVIEFSCSEGDDWNLDARGAEEAKLKAERLRHRVDMIENEFGGRYPIILVIRPKDEVDETAMGLLVEEIATEKPHLDVIVADYRDIR